MVSLQNGQDAIRVPFPVGDSGMFVQVRDHIHCVINVTPKVVQGMF
jgi:hypothetical protein